MKRNIVRVLFACSLLLFATSFAVGPGLVAPEKAQAKLIRVPAEDPNCIYVLHVINGQILHVWYLCN